MQKKKEQFETMIEITSKFNLYLSSISGRTNYVLAMDDDDNRDERLRYIGRVYRSFMALCPEEKEIINNEFFSKSQFEWWKSRYNISEFKLLLFSSITHFLERFSVNEKG